MHYVRFMKYGDPLYSKRKVNSNQPDKCTVKGCSKPHKARGYCNYHLTNARRKGLLTNVKCRVENCNINAYAKGYCFSHYTNNNLCGNPLRFRTRTLKNKICSVQGCSEPAKRVSYKSRRAYCKFHYVRKVHKDIGHIKCSLKRPKGNKGELNHSWKGGIADYPNHYEFKKARLRVLEKANYKCIKCGDRATNVHHKDGTKHNHADENLEPLCHKCHHKYYHRGTKHASKYTKLYGAHRYELAKQLRCSTQTINNLHTQGILHERLEAAQLITV